MCSEQEHRDLVNAVKDACEAMEKAELLIAGLRVEVDYWKKMAVTND
jgi:hypothetical protein